MSDLESRDKDLIETDDILDDVVMIVMMIVMMSFMMSGMLQSFTGQAQAATAVEGITDYHYLNVSSFVQEITFTNPLKTLVVENLGTTTLWVKTNTLNSKAVPAEQGQAVELDAGTGAFYRMFYYTISGVTQGTVRGMY